MHRNFPQPSPHAARRGGPGPMVAPPNPQQHAPPPPPMNAAQLQQQHLESIRRQDAVRRLSKKPTDREVPEELTEVVIGDGVERYKRLRDVERQLDAVMMRKRLDVSDNLQRRYNRREGVLRLWISNTAEGQPWQVVEEGGGMNDDGTFELGESSQATFRVKLEGRLIDQSINDDDDDITQSQPQSEAGEDKEKPAATTSVTHRSRLSNFFKAITIDFSRSAALQPDGYSAIEWRKPQPGPQNPNYDPNAPEASFDTLEFTRKSDENINVTINLVRDEPNERYKLSPQLAEILDMEEDERAGIVQGIWEYCRFMGLQEDDDKRSIVCDEPLRKLFGKDTVYFPYVADLLNPHLQPVPPVSLKYTIRVDKSYIKGDTTTSTPPSVPTIYDIRVPLPNPLVREVTRFHSSKTHLSDLSAIVKTDDELALLVQKIHQTNAKRKFYDNLAKDPTSFVKRWMASQQRDLEVIMAEALRGTGSADESLAEQYRHGGPESLWNSQQAKESVGLWLAKSSRAH